VQKPNRSYYETIFAYYGDTAREKYLMIGDSLSADIAGGINAGIDTCWYRPFGAGEPEIRPTYTVNGYDELLRLLL